MVQLQLPDVRQRVGLAAWMNRAADLVIEVDLNQPHTWWGPSVHRWCCNAEEGLHVCMRGARVDGRPELGPHRCACGYRWEAA